MTHLTSEDASAIQHYVQRNYLSRASTRDVREAIEASALQNPRHEIREYLTGLVWDGVPRLSTWLTTYVGVEDSVYSQAVGRMFLISMVARVMQPGCRADYMLVVEGEQGLMKSTMCRVLAGEAYFSDSLPAVRSNKDVVAHLKGKWLIELPELAAIKAGDDNDVKAFLTGQIDKFRPHYGRSEIEQARQVVFIGTTNDSGYLKDPTGSRRYGPVKALLILIEELKRDRDQLFAEAMAAFGAGERWWPDREFESEFIEPEQDRRYEEDAWVQPIRDWLAVREKTTLVDMIVEALGMERKSVGRAHQNRAMAVMSRLGWERAARDAKGNRPWIRGPKAEPIRALS
jgi:predicted P-loop ATPase